MFIKSISTASLIFALLSPVVAQQSKPPPGVLVAPASQQDLVRTSDLLGKTMAVNDVSIRARVSSYLLEKNFREGSEVEKGTILFRLDPEIYQAVVAADKAGVSEAKALVAQTTSDFARYTELSKKNYVSKQDLDLSRANKLQAIAKLESAYAKLSRSKIDLADTVLSAPISGRVGRSNISIGNLVDSSSGELVRLVELDPIYVSFNISESQLLTIQAQAEARELHGDSPEHFNFKLILPDGELHPQAGSLEFIDNVVNPLTGTILVRAKFASPDKNLIPGLNVIIQISSQEAATELTIPQVSVQEDQTGYFVMVVDNSNRVEKRAVTLGRKVGVDWVVNDGLIIGEMVIVSGVQKVRPGITVNPEPAPTLNPKG
ncbi:MAG: efflux RND transporter periplasmic adaptor subunit [Xanthomonadales bacterium]|nr:efflux RND transporter periplasmic adaptor subunit [Xanthomonadales bacterium]